MTKRENGSANSSKYPLGRKLTRDEINSLDIGAYQGPVELVRSHEHMLKAARKLQEERLLGFDSETRPAFKKGVSHPTALVQLAASNCVYVFQLRYLKDLGELFSVLANRKIIKAGVATSDDTKALRELSDFEPAGFVDVGRCAQVRHAAPWSARACGTSPGVSDHEVESAV